MKEAIQNSPGRAKFDLFGKYGIEMVLLAVVIVSAIVEPKFLSLSNLMSVLRQISITGPIALGMTFIIINGNIDLSVGGVVGLSSMISVWLVAEGFPIILAVLCAAVIGIITGIINAYNVYKGLAPFIVTMSTNLILRGLCYLMTNGQPVWGVPDSYLVIGQGFLEPTLINQIIFPIAAFAIVIIMGIPHLKRKKRVARTYITATIALALVYAFVRLRFAIPIVIFLVIFFIAQFVLEHTTVGRNVYAVGGGRESARLSGISILFSKGFVFCVSGVLAAVTGVVLSSRLGSSDPTIGIDYQVDAIAATVIGGTSMSGGEGKIAKTLVGILIIGLLSNILNLANISPYVQQVVKGLIIFVAVVWDNSKRKNKK